MRYFELANKELVQVMFEFNCKEKFFNDYLKMNALYDKASGLGTTHLFIEEDGNQSKKVIGFYTLKNTSLVFKHEEDGTREGFPAIEISQFATCEHLERQGIGRIMIKDIIAKVHMLKEISSIKYIVLCSTKESIDFYDKMKFDPIEKNKFIPRENWNKRCHPMFRNIVVKE